MGISERYAEAFARAFAVFVCELEREAVEQRGSTESPAPSTTGSPEDEESLAQQFLQTIGGTETSAAAETRDDFLEMTGGSVSQGIAVRLRRIIKRRGLTQKQLAEKLGVTPARVSSVLKNPDRSQVDTLRRIADALDIELREML